jgi:hypothetical protein
MGQSESGSEEGGELDNYGINSRSRGALKGNRISHKNNVGGLTGKTGESQRGVPG